MKRSDCGIVFLGDFWHTRGSLKVMVHTCVPDYNTQPEPLPGPRQILDGARRPTVHYPLSRSHGRAKEILHAAMPVVLVKLKHSFVGTRQLTHPIDRIPNVPDVIVGYHELTMSHPFSSSTWFRRIPVVAFNGIMIALVSVNLD